LSLAPRVLKVLRLLARESGAVVIVWILHPNFEVFHVWRARRAAIRFRNSATAGTPPTAESCGCHMRLRALANPLRRARATIDGLAKRLSVSLSCLSGLRLPQRGAFRVRSRHRTRACSLSPHRLAYPFTRPSTTHGLDPKSRRRRSRT
jgi:hypothetical protein